MVTSPFDVSLCFFDCLISRVVQAESDARFLFDKVLYIFVAAHVFGAGFLHLFRFPTVLRKAR